MKAAMRMSILVLMLATAWNVYAQEGSSRDLENEKGTSMKPILSNVNQIIERLEEDSLEIVRMEFDIVIDTKSTFRQMANVWKYGVLVVGDYRVEDIDVYVYKEVDGDWTLVKKDDSAESYALVTIEPSSSALYRIDVKAHKLKEGYSAAHYGLLVYHQ